eukprot:TRINITY_DN20578_c0_g1_i1.p1 TRINITY_DN20578_c0_g1~~TRINITY_DN20578_c0_g1_i1.p1  ORF type:complete len:782 (+),score=294.35 TRINITY_DN20578_c0_g1_i1:42-2387(+)
MSGCSGLTSCGMCLWDATVVVEDHERDLECHWCITTSTCVPSQTAGSCQNLLFSNETHSVCPELQCHLAPVAFNVYACLSPALVLFWFNVALLVYCILLLLWIRAVGQKPWAVPGLRSTAKRRWEGISLAPSAPSNDLEEAFDHLDDDIDAEYTEVLSTPGSSSKKECRHCKKGSECGWCTMTRVAFLPLLLTCTTGVTNIVTTLLFSLKPSFYIPYMSATLLLVVITHVAFFGKFLYPLLKGNASWDPAYIRMAFMLRGRRIDSVFSRHKEGDMSEDEHNDTLKERKGIVPYLSQFPSFFGGLYDMVYGPDANQAEDGTPADPPAPPVETPPIAPIGTSSSSVPSCMTVEVPEVALAAPSAGTPQPQNLELSTSSVTLQVPVQTGTNPLGSSRNTPSPMGTPLGGEHGAAPSRRNSAYALETRDSRHLIMAENMADMVEAESDGVPLLLESQDDSLARKLQSLDPALRQCLLDLLSAEEEVENERVVWCCVPAFKHLLLHDMMFLHTCATIVLSSILFFSIASDSDLRVYKIIGPTNLHVVGVLAVVIPCLIVAMFVASCQRAYFMTTHNVMTLCKGLWGITAAVQSNQDIGCGLVSRYQEFGVHFSAFSWRQPIGQKRRMPALPLSEFACINNPSDMKTLIQKVRRFCPPFSSSIWKGSTQELAQEWRLHMALVYSALLLCCTTFHYTEAVPVNILVLAFVCCASFCVAVFSKGLRHHFTRNTPLDTSRSKSKWHKPRWVVMEVDAEEPFSQLPATEEVLDSLARTARKEHHRLRRGQE